MNVPTHTRVRTLTRVNTNIRARACTFKWTYKCMYVCTCRQTGVLCVHADRQGCCVYPFIDMVRKKVFAVHVCLPISFSYLSPLIISLSLSLLVVVYHLPPLSVSFPLFLPLPPFLSLILSPLSLILFLPLPSLSSIACNHQTRRIARERRPPGAGGAPDDPRSPSRNRPIAARNSREKEGSARRG